MWNVKINHRPVYEFKEFKEAYQFAKLWNTGLQYQP